MLSSKKRPRGSDQFDDCLFRAAVITKNAIRSTASMSLTHPIFREKMSATVIELGSSGFSSGSKYKEKGRKRHQLDWKRNLEPLVELRQRPDETGKAGSSTEGRLLDLPRVKRRCIYLSTPGEQRAGARGDVRDPGGSRGPRSAPPLPPPSPPPPPARTAAAAAAVFEAQGPGAAASRSSRGIAERGEQTGGRAIREPERPGNRQQLRGGPRATRPTLQQTWARARATAPAAGAMKMVAPWTRFYSNSCCLCCHVRTGTILLGVWYLIINAVVLLILLSALADPHQYHFSSSELGGDFEFMDDANMCIAIAISLLMILICAMATYGAYKQHAAWIIPFFCYQIFDFALNALVAITVLVYPNSIQEYIRQLPPNFPYRDDIMSVNPTCLVLIILLFISIILTFKGYLISCVWNCYRYINGRNSSDVLVYVTSNDTAVLLPPYDDATVNGAAKEPPPPYVSA
ncbi:PREDICTED: lysosomal-associated transmembrane protein 4B [Galeopterus variegatus]|uniref:Lysosomal-associated transmembrane protein 4B n=1 Tax=Galeopterus variegatus TaxID=482537 RepID=A0ABM0QYJ7_GALVR|nr:PREDICTED: lysosomal-associated transmembrane protein 4B [Galeopterus variegatus]